MGTGENCTSPDNTPPTAYPPVAEKSPLVLSTAAQLKKPRTGHPLWPLPSGSFLWARDRCLSRSHLGWTVKANGITESTLGSYEYIRRKKH